MLGRPLRPIWALTESQNEPPEGAIITDPIDKPADTLQTGTAEECEGRVINGSNYKQLIQEGQKEVGSVGSLVGNNVQMEGDTTFGEGEISETMEGEYEGAVTSDPCVNQLMIEGESGRERSMTNCDYQDVRATDNHLEV